MKHLTRPVKITVCADGFVSLCEEMADRRLKAALPFHSAWTRAEAIALIQRVCELHPCRHGGKVGMTVEPRAPNWPAGTHVECTSYIDDLADIFQAAELEMQVEARIAWRG